MKFVKLCLVSLFSLFAFVSSSQAQSFRITMSEDEIRQEVLKCYSAYDETPQACNDLFEDIAFKRQSPEILKLAHDWYEARCFQHREASKCLRLGDSLLGSDEVDDEARGLEFISYACSLGFNYACTNFEERKNKILPDVHAQFAGVQSDCFSDDGLACAELGWVYFEGDGVSVNYSTAFAYLYRACILDDGEACAGVGLSFGEGYGVDPNGKRAVDFSKQACHDGIMWACRNLGVFYLNSPLLERDPETSVFYHEIACEGDVIDSCSEVGRAYLYGEGKPEDGIKALEYLTPPCEAGNATACNRVGLVYSMGVDVEIDNAKSFEYSKMGCEKGSPAGCNNVGAAYMNGEGVQKNKTLARMYIQQALDLNPNLQIARENMDILDGK